MRLDEMTVHIRPLPPYQALDLGLAMARAWYKELSSFWLYNFWIGVVLVNIFWSIFVPFSLFKFWLTMLFLLIARVQTEIKMMLLLSQKVFDEHANIYSTQPLWQAQKNITLKSLPKALFPTRIVGYAVALLENQSGKAKSQRLNALLKGNSNALWLNAFVFAGIELVLFFAVVWLFMQFFGTPTNPLLDNDDMGVLEFLSHHSDGFSLKLTPIAYLLVSIITTPFFVASSFALYLCRRSLLEGWDIELEFRQMSDRYQTLQQASKPTPPAQGGEQ